MFIEDYEYKLVSETPAELVPDRKSLNDITRSHLMNDGDDGTIPRDVMHMLVKTDAPDAVDGYDLAEMLAGYGFSVRVTDEYDSIVINYETEVASSKFDLFVEAFEDYLADIGWEYDGWFARLVKPDQLH